MARYVATLHTPRSAAEVFEFMADFRNVATWDPSIRRVVQVHGDGPGPDAVFDVTISNPGRDLTLRYRTIAYDSPKSVRLLASSWMFNSDDRITVSADGDGTRLVYDARLMLNGLLRLGDPLLGLVFGRVGGRAAEGLRKALDARRID